MEGMLTQDKGKKTKEVSNELNVIQLAHPPRHPKLQNEDTNKGITLNPSLIQPSLASIHQASLGTNKCQQRRRSDVPSGSIPPQFMPIDKSGNKPDKTSSFTISSPGSSFPSQNISQQKVCHQSRRMSKPNFEFRASGSETFKIFKISQLLPGETIALYRPKRNSDASLIPTEIPSLKTFQIPATSDGKQPHKDSTPTSIAANLEKGSSPEDQVIPLIPPPPDPKRKGFPMTHRRSVDLDLSRKDLRKASITRPHSSLSSFHSSLANCSGHLSPAKQFPEVSDGSGSSFELLNSETTLQNKSAFYAEKSSLSPPMMQKKSDCQMCSDNSTNLFSKVQMTLSGLSPPHSRSSDELDTILPAYVPLLSTPDLKIELLEEERRMSIVNCQFNPSFLPQGFPNFTPNDLTPEEIHEFDMKWGSPHHGRGIRGLTRPTLLALPPTRPRMTSLPNRERETEIDEEEEDYYRLRHFSITGRGVINRGDSFRSRRTKSNTSVASDVSSNDGWIWSHPCSVRTSAASSAASSRASSASECVFPYRVIMLGAPGVGKTTLCHQFMTSEHINAYDSSMDEEYGEKSVSVLLDGEESEIQFIDHPAEEMSVENCLATYNPHAIVVVFSVVDRESYVRAEEILQYLWRLDIMSNKGVILVGNKTDLVRNRCISAKESSNLAESYDSKFIETSSGLDHNVDELLVGVLKQIRLKIHNPDVSREVFRKRSTRRKKYRGTKTSASLKVKGLLTKVCGKDIKSKSCENLHVL